jgi:protoporphyrin/coproporphyrin ferrochelatase
VVARVEEALAQAPQAPRLVFTAHSIPLGMARGCDYEAQLREVAAIVAERVGQPAHDLVYQSRSGPPGAPWLEPDIGDHLRRLAGEGVKSALIVPLGFVSDHMEVVWDLDHEAKAIADGLGMSLTRAATVGEHPLFLAMIRELIEEKLGRIATRRYVGSAGPRPDVCAPGCCAYSPGPPGRPGRP